MYQVTKDVKELAQLLPRPGSKYLDLSDTFAAVWQGTIAPLITPKTSLFLLLRDTAGFTDSRIVYLWIKGAGFFGNQPYYVSQIGVDDWDSESTEHTYTLLTRAKKQNNQSLEYAKEPNIGTK